MEALKHKFTQGLQGLTYVHWHKNFRLQSQRAKMPDLGHPQSLTSTTFKAHAHFSSQHLLIKLCVPHEYGIC